MQRDYEQVTITIGRETGKNFSFLYFPDSRGAWHWLEDIFRFAERESTATRFDA